MSSLTRKALTAGGFVVSVLVAATGIESIRQAHAEPATAVPQQVAQATSSTKSPPATFNVADALSKAFRDAAHTALPAVVSIEISGQQLVSDQNGSPFRGFPFFDNTPRRGQQPETQQVHGYGSGFVFRPNGYIMTNNHVVEDASRVTVRFSDGREMAARVVGRDPDTDIAVVKVDASGLPVLDYGNSDATDVGDWVVALGFPLTLRNSATVTAGIISAKGRSLGILRQNNDQALEHDIQTDAAINKGNSGGPLVDLNGHVIGVNAVIESPTGYFSGYGFAIPVNIARRVANDLIKYGEPHRARLGVQVKDLNDADKEATHAPSLDGALVSEVQPGTAADKAGVQLGDVIVSIDGTPIHDGGELTEMLQQKFEPGQKAKLDLYRSGRRMTVNVTLGAFASTIRKERTASGPTREHGVSRLGFSASDITPQLARSMELGDAPRKGVVITDVDPNSSASQYLAEGWIIDQFNGKAITSVDDLDHATASVKQGDVVSLIVRLPPDWQRTVVNYRVRQ